MRQLTVERNCADSVQLDSDSLMFCPPNRFTAGDYILPSNQLFCMDALKRLLILPYHERAFSQSDTKRGALITEAYVIAIVSFRIV